VSGQLRAFALARESLSLTAERRKKSYDIPKKTEYVRVIMQWEYYFCPRHRIGRSPKWQKFYSRPLLLIDVLGFINLRIQKTSRSSPMVLHVDTVKRYYGVAPTSRLSDKMGRDVLSTLDGDTL